jgi:hypothetical protein
MKALQSHVIVLLLGFVAIACWSDEATPNGLLSELGAYSDSFEWDPGTKRYVLRRPEAIEAIVAAHYTSRHSTLDDLVNCISDESPSHVLLKDSPVVLGVVCYEGLTKLIYFESDSSRWAGYVDASATHQQLLAAQKAWRRVVQKKEYTNL